MKQKYSKFTSKLTVNPPASAEIINSVEEEMKISFPLEYLEFLSVTNGAKGVVGENSYVDFWAIEDIIQDNIDYEVEEYAPGLILIGSSGGGLAYAIDTRKTTMPIVEVPFIGMDLDEVVPRGERFIQFLDYLYNN